MFVNDTELPQWKRSAGRQTKTPAAEAGVCRTPVAHCKRPYGSGIGYVKSAYQYADFDS